MKATCEECKKEFEITQDMLQEKYLGAMMTETFYHCPKCSKKYVVCVMNNKARRLKQKMEQLKLVIRDKQSRGIKYIPEAIEVNEVVKELSNEMDRINGKA